RHCRSRAPRFQDHRTQGSHPVWPFPCSRWCCRPLLRRKARDLVHERIRRLGVRGVGLAELIVVVAILGLLAALGVPYLVSYWQASPFTAGAQEHQTFLNGARQLAIRNNTSVCVKRNSPGIQYLTNGCAGTVWTGAATDNAGWIPLVNGVQITAAPAP